MKDFESKNHPRKVVTSSAPLQMTEETLIADIRSSLSPAQMVEQRLIHMLQASPLMMSQVQGRMKPGPR